jgi:hypothetical protein
MSIQTEKLPLRKSETSQIDKIAGLRKVVL